MDTALTLTTTYLRQEYTCSLVQMLQRLTLPFAQRLRVDELLYDLYLGLVSIREREEQEGNGGNERKCARKESMNGGAALIA